MLIHAMFRCEAIAGTSASMCALTCSPWEMLAALPHQRAQNSCGQFHVWMLPRENRRKGSHPSPQANYFH